MPIAIVGCAFRFPGDLADETSLWHALKQGQDMVGTIGPERWATDQLRHPKRSEPGRSISFSAGVLSRIDEFDANFFGISPREAAWLDPQQRLLLELTWEAMENAGQVPSQLEGSRCGVFVGISGLDYGMRGLDDLASMSAHSMTGNTLSIAANRLSYVFDLRGPSMAVDTACSSSMVALHQACCSLQSGESATALVGGANLLLHPYPFVGFTKASMLSARGRCRPFDAGADGYVRAEGAAVLMLKPLSVAERDGDPILAVILGSGANTDGGRKTGMTIPSSAGQAELMRAVMTRAGVTPQQVDYVEAHGTGTAVGDPIEASAIGEVYGQGRAAPLPIGSVKSNLGHLEPASGMAGLVKTLLMLQHRGLPPSLHFDTPNPHIDFRALNLQVVSEFLHLPKSPRRLPVMGVNSFGFGGANAHVLLRAYPPRPPLARGPDAPVPPLFLSARTDEALRALADRYARFLKSPDAPAYYDIAHSSAYRRAHLERRLAVRAEDPASVAALLERFAGGTVAAELVLENALPESGTIAFVYSGNGAQWAGMGQRLLAESTRFAELMTELDAAMADRAHFSILAALHADAANAHLDDTAIAQPLLFAMQVAITRLLREQGLEPAAVTGHSVGEVAAAWAAGALDLDAAIDVICARSTAQALTRGQGRMAAVSLPEAAARALLDEQGLASLEIAGINSPGAVTLSGSLVELQLLQAMLEARQVFCRVLDLDYAFHSRAMDPIRDGLLASLATLVPGRTTLPFVSTVHGRLVDGETLTAGYWWDNIRAPVRFASAVQDLIERGCRVLLEIGPHAILQTYLGECLGAAKVTGRVLPTLRRGNDGLGRLEEAALRARLVQHQPDLAAYFPLPGRHQRLPNYPWQRERHWHPISTESHALIARHRVHPLLGWRVTEAECTWENTIDAIALPYLDDHRVAGAVVFPAAGYVELALACAREHFGGERFELEELDILAPIVLDADHARSVRCEFVPGESVLRIRSRQRLSEDTWALHAIARLTGAPTLAAPEPDLSGVAGRNIEAAAHYRLAHALGLQYGPAFQDFEGGVLDGDVLRGLLRDSAAPRGDTAGYLLHPAALDACFQSLVHFFEADIEAGHALPLLPVKIGRLRYFGGSRPRAFGARLKRQGLRSVLADFILLDAEDRVVAVLEDVRFRAASVQRQTSSEPALWDVVPRLTPHPAERASAGLAGNRAWAEIAQAALEALAGPLAREAYFHDALPLSDALVVSFAFRSFRELEARGGGWVARALEEPQSMAPERRALFQWLATRLQAAALLARDEDGWHLNLNRAPPPPEDIFRTLLADFPDSLPELLCVGRVGRRLADLIDGRIDQQALSGGIRGSHLLEPLFETAPAYRATNLALAELLDAIARQWPRNRRLRVLEIGNGTSELPHRLETRLDPDRIDYVIAGTGGERHSRLQADYEGHPYVTVATLRTEDMSLGAGNPLPADYDLIIAHHWLHGVPQLSAALAGLHSKLAPAGRLLLVERHPDAAADLVFGVDPSWWHDGEHGPSSSLMTPKAWEKLLTDGGFDEIETIIEPHARATRSGAYLLLARNPAAAPAASEPERSGWLLVCRPEGPSRRLAERLALHLESHAQRIVLASVGNESLRRLVEAAQHELGRIDHVVYLAAVVGEESAPELGTEGLESADSLGALELVHTLAATSASPPRLWLVGAGGALAAPTAGTACIHPRSAALWGFGRVLMNENPALDCTLIDLGVDPSSAEAAERLQQELLAPDGEREIVLRAEGRYGLRLRRSTALAHDAAETERFRLDFRVPGQLRNLEWFAAPARTLGPHEIEVRPMAVGLNFRDVMYAMGLLPDEVVENGFSGASLGLEFAGVVSRTGKDVTEYQPGDEVMGFAPACFASHVVTTAEAVATKPPDWSFAQAATVPVAFFTVYYALKHLANLQPGERVLVHGGAGAVGIAAVQLARHLGAEVFATAGSDEKRDFVHLLGADQVFDSRSLAFADEILGVTDGEGVDVILNSLAGEAINRNLRALKPFGRFLELGKRDFVENTHIGLRPFKNNISYFGIDADQLLVARPELGSRLFGEVMDLFRDGALVPLPAREFPARRVVDAFRYMQQSRQIGKVVLDLREASVPVRQLERKPAPLRLSRDATYLVSGGLSGFGLESARALASRGAGHLVLLGRRGLATPGAEQAIASLEELGAHVHVFACDVADRPALQAVLQTVGRDLPPLRGVLHAAMVLDDGLIATMDARRFNRVFAPKVLGARHLHELTLDHALDHFILYSSVTTCIGNPGQANYVAANAYLESLVAWRRARGLTGTCVAWGPIGDVGYLSRNAALKDSLAARLGTPPLSSRAALDMLERILVADLAQVTVADLNWPTLARLLPSAGGPRFDGLRRSAGAGDADDESSLDIKALIAGKSPDEVRQIVHDMIVKEVSQILRLGPERIDPARSLYDLGMDSLMAMELALGIEKRTGLNLPAMALNEGPSVERIAARLTARLCEGAGQSASAGDTLEHLVRTMAVQHSEDITSHEIDATVADVRREAQAGARLIP